MKTATKTKFKQTEIGKSPELGTAGEWRQARLAEICVHSAFGPRFSGELYAPDGNVATLRTTDISEDGRIEYATMPLARLDLSKFQQHLLHEVIWSSQELGELARPQSSMVFDCPS